MLPVCPRAHLPDPADLLDDQMEASAEVWEESEAKGYESPPPLPPPAHGPEEEQVTDGPSKAHIFMESFAGEAA